MRKKPDLAIVPEDHSFRIESESELLKAFDEKDQKRVLLPQGLEYPINARHYLAWRESSGNYVYLVFKKPSWKSPMGLVFKRPTHSGERVASHCDWCLSYGTATDVALLGLKLNSRESIGMMLCSDLACANRLEAVAELSGKNFEKLAGQLYEKIEKLYATVIKSRSRHHEETSSDGQF